MVHKVNAGASILAWLILTLIYFIFTVDTLISWNTLTSVSANEIAAGGTVLAGIGRTLVQLLLAVAPRVAQWALAVVRVASVDAGTRVLAQVLGKHAFVEGCHLTGNVGHVTVRTGPSRWTQAPGLRLFLHTGAFVFTRGPTAEVHQSLAVLPRVAQGAGAAVGS